MCCLGEIRHPTQRVLLSACIIRLSRPRCGATACACWHGQRKCQLSMSWPITCSCSCCLSYLFRFMQSKKSNGISFSNLVICPHCLLFLSFFPQAEPKYVKFSWHQMASRAVLVPFLRPPKLSWHAFNRLSILSNDFGLIQLTITPLGWLSSSLDFRCSLGAFLILLATLAYIVQRSTYANCRCQQ